MSDTYKTKFNLGAGFGASFLISGGNFVENNSPESLSNFMRHARHCLETFPEAQAFIDSRLGAGGWQTACDYGWGACVESPTKLFTKKENGKGYRPPAIIIPLKNDDDEIVGVSCRRFLAIPRTDGGWDFPAFSKYAENFYQYYPKGDGDFELDEVDDPRWLARGDKSLLNNARDALAARPCFVVEGFFDFLALKMAGFACVCLNGASYSPFIRFLENTETDAVFIFCSDNDSAKAGKGSECGQGNEADARYIIANAIECRGIHVLQRGFLTGQTPETLAWLDENGIKDAADFWQKGINNTEIRSRFLAHFGALESQAKQAQNALRAMRALDVKNENPQSAAECHFERHFHAA